MAAGAPATIIDYGMGNLRSVERALAAAGGIPRISGDPREVRSGKRLILPGVGAFGDAMDNLRRTGLDLAIRDSVAGGTPLLGLCLGLQLLFGQSEEFGLHEGLGLIPGKVRRLAPPDLHVPHVGWNQVEVVHADPLLEGIADRSYFYFLHSYYVEPEQDSDILGRTEYGQYFCSIGHRGNVWGAQFHPEKSQETGLRLLRNFLTRA